MSILHNLTLSKALNLLEKGEITAVNLTEHYLKKIQNSEKLNAYSRSNLPNTVFTRDRKCWSIKKGRFGVVASDKSGFKDWRASLISHPKYESQEQLFANITDRKLISRGTRNSSGTPRSVVRKSGNKIGKIYEKAKGKVWQGNPGFMERLKRARISLDDFGSNRKWRKDRG